MTREADKYIIGKGTLYHVGLLDGGVPIIVAPYVCSLEYAIIFSLLFIFFLLLFFSPQSFNEDSKINDY